MHRIKYLMRMFRLGFLKFLAVADWMWQDTRMKRDKLPEV